MSGLPGPSAAVWNRLAEASDNIFATRDWAEAWWTHHGDGASPVIVTDDDLDPTVIWPLVRNGGLVRQVRLLGHGTSDRLGPVCAPGQEKKAGALLRSTLDSWNWDTIVLHDVDPDPSWTADLGLRELRDVASPTVRFPAGGWDDFLRARSKNFREQARRRETKLRRDYAVSFRLATEATLEDDLAVLFRLHGARWGSEADFAGPISRAFHGDFAARALANGWLRLWILELDGEAVAASYGFRFGRSEYYYQGGRDPRFDRQSVGFVLMIHALREACGADMTDFRLLRGDEDYKSRFATETHRVATLAAGAGPRGSAAIRAAEWRRRAADRRAAR